MSLYNMLCGYTPAVTLVLPMLGKHPNEYPRFRDCFLKDEEHPEYDDHIQIYTRTGGGNREDYESENEAMRQMDGFVADFDDSFDSTFASWVFKVPERWKADYEVFKSGDLKDMSKEYQEELRRILPEIEESLWDKIFAMHVDRVQEEDGA